MPRTSLGRDVVGLADALHAERCALVGHHWGGLPAWHVAARMPQRVERVAILNAPHPGAFQRFIVRQPTQAVRSAYLGVLQVPFLPEQLLLRVELRRAALHAGAHGARRHVHRR